MSLSGPPVRHRRRCPEKAALHPNRFVMICRSLRVLETSTLLGRGHKAPAAPRSSAPGARRGGGPPNAKGDRGHGGGRGGGGDALSLLTNFLGAGAGAEQALAEDQGPLGVPVGPLPQGSGLQAAALEAGPRTPLLSRSCSNIFGDSSLPAQRQDGEDPNTDQLKGALQLSLFLPTACFSLESTEGPVDLADNRSRPLRRECVAA